MFYKIGDFSLKTGISIKTLRYYDEINLFKPSYIDCFSGYRYYEINQIKDIKLISKLKEIGLSLEEIKQFLVNKDISIVMNKRKIFEEKTKRIDEFMREKEEIAVYNIEKGNYKKYIEINGIRQAKCPQALEIRDSNSMYFVVEKDREFYTDFCIYNKDNWLTIDKKEFFNEEFLDFLISYVSIEIDYFTIYVPVEDEKLYSLINNKFKNICEEKFVQGEYEYRRLKIILKES